jgi:hypothetical protein
VKILFLDIDGVLNSRVYLQDKPLRAGEKPSIRDEDGIDPAAVARLQRIVNATGAVICVSSSWRKQYPLPMLCRMLRRRGLTEQRLIGVTPDLKHISPGSVRGDEIELWLSLFGHARPRFAILDDYADMGSLLPFLVQTDATRGMTDADVTEAIRLLGQ